MSLTKPQKTYKRIGIVTINDYTNYGNRLQNYALQTLLSQFGPCETIFCYANDDTPSKKKQIADCAKTIMKFCAGGVHHLTGKRELAFRKFTKELAPDDKATVDYRNGLLPKGTHFDCIVAGSDQVWNDRYISQSGLRLRLCSFASNQTRLISYAASFGVDNVKKSSEDSFRTYLPRFSALSVREDRAKELVHELSGEEATVVIDPTLMLTADQWLSITQGFVKPDDRYVLTYFLGHLSPEQDQIIQDYARKHHCRVRNIYSYYSFSDDAENYPVGPREFVELFAKAQYVFTDSYHACCFSIIFNKDFKVFGRNGLSAKDNMNSRMETLFRLFELGEAFNESTEGHAIDYAHVNQLLEQYRTESGQWLTNALS
ncbi:polysaccharide pyruvyl transferase family protein [Bifidobacterium callimiconis]|uniref:polysaccharide pyruvyl transferase family protein n=1 Tax=Bifidobacterium callimiconis TaxID=2306973 RepID=UPI001BDDB7BF|nr:polysaccharide pyruvyl transferase family protein [Bifidobacterium callimiconis]MBT1177300.1 polysaccharide pyruvyl transferase family protein [Bifidobacterium callimiconis]